MKVGWKEMTVSPDGIDIDELLSDWRWLVDDSFSPVVITAMGDLFLRDAEGQIHWLDTMEGKLTRVAASAANFKKLMQQPEHAQEWFMPQLVGDLMTLGICLDEGEVYSCEHPLALGGELVPENIEPCDIYMHMSLQGQIHEQIKDLPPGTEISGITMKGPSLIDRIRHSFSSLFGR